MSNLMMCRDLDKLTELRKNISTALREGILTTRGKCNYDLLDTLELTIRHVQDCHQSELEYAGNGAGLFLSYYESYDISEITYYLSSDKHPTPISTPPTTKFGSCIRTYANMLGLGLSKSRLNQLVLNMQALKLDHPVAFKYLDLIYRDNVTDYIDNIDLCWELFKPVYVKSFDTMLSQLKVDVVSYDEFLETCLDVDVHADDNIIRINKS